MLELVTLNVHMDVTDHLPRTVISAWRTPKEERQLDTLMDQPEQDTVYAQEPGLEMIVASQVFNVTQAAQHVTDQSNTNVTLATWDLH